VMQGRAAAVVSSLPLLTKPERLRLDLLHEAFGLLRPEGVFVQFTYGIGSPVPRVDEFFRPAGFHATVSPPVWLNLPPAWVWTYRPSAAHNTEILRQRRDVLLRFKAGREKLGDDWREKRRRFHDEFVLRAEKAKHEFKLRTDRLKVGIERHQSLVDDGVGKVAVDLFDRPKSGFDRPNAGKKAPW
jgi:phosphatidylethanolamine/phosphatidyl-N-methylethanolamine N-methyltransferase